MGVPIAPFGDRGIPPPIPYGGLSPVSRGYPPPEGRLPTCYSAVRREWVNPPLPSLPWVSRTGIAVASRRINGNSAGKIFSQPRAYPREVRPQLQALPTGYPLFRVILTSVPAVGHLGSSKEYPCPQMTPRGYVCSIV